METRASPLQFFTDAFHALTGNVPLKWQERLFQERFLNDAIPTMLDLPTGLGKTSVMAIWYLALKAGARLPRRLVYVVDRRAVVDQATVEAEKIREWARRARHEELPISTLRGQYADNRAWLENPAAEAVIVGTVDMIGSRLLFEGYGVSRKMRPYHAGLLGADALVVLDESHLVPPFERLLEAIAENAELGPKGETNRDLIPRFRLLPLSATGRERDGNVFRLTEDDREDSVVRERLAAKKCLTFEHADGKKLEERLAKEAWALSGEGKAPVRILTYCNSREVAEKTKAAIEKLAKPAKLLPENFQLFVGARRVKEREAAKRSLEDLGFFSGNDAPEKPAFVIATSAGEVGVDLDADHMVMDLVPFERMVQRLGRVNRLGGESRKAQVVVMHGDEPKPKKPKEPNPEELRETCAWRALKLLQKLPQHEDCTHDASPGALVDLKKDHNDLVIAASSPVPLHPALTRALVDAWSMTSLKEHTGRPEVAPWLRGWVEDDQPQTTLVWRKHLPVRTRGGTTTGREIEDFFAAASPHLTERLETYTFVVRDWLLARVAKIAGERAKSGDKDDEAFTALMSLGPKDIVAVTLGRSGEETLLFTLGFLLKAGEGRKGKDSLERSLRGRTLVVDGRLGGLSGDGLLAKDAKVEPPVADAENGWPDPEIGKPLVPFRVRRLKVGKVEDDADEEEVSAAYTPLNWQPTFAFDTERDTDNNPLVQLVVEKWRSEPTDEDARAISSRAQALAEHQEWAARKAKELVDALHLEGDIARAIVLAARLHDEGKQADRWQRAFRTPATGRPYGKTGSRRAPDFAILARYRHEFGSLLYVENNDVFRALPGDLKDLVLHLVAAHHGRARPVIGTEGCDDGPPSVLEARAREVTLRFARLQKRWGPWGLAWLEAILRAADQQASRDLDEGKAPYG